MNSFSNWLLNPGHYLIPGLPSAVVLLLAVALALSALGFARLVYFISVGYGLSAAGIAFFSFVVYRTNGNFGALLHMLLILIYGFRLATYLLKRDRASSFQKERTETEERYRIRGITAKLGIWIGVSLLYVAMASPVLFHFSTLYAMSHAAAGSEVTPSLGSGAATVFVVFGLFVGFFGLVLEWSADSQKAREKRRNPSAFCDSGLYRIVRYPNYLGEMLVWTGSWVAGIPFYTAWSAWVLSLVGLVCIILIMLGSAKRLEAKQNERYGTDRAYAEYTRSVPVIIPFIPLYTLKKLKVYLG